MKRLGLLVLFLNVFLSKAQESQEVTASKWKDGVYDLYTVDMFNDTLWKKNTDKINLTIKRGIKNKIVKVSLLGDYPIGNFTHYDSSSTPFVRYYMSKENYDDKKIYFNEKTIAVYNIKQSWTNKLEIKILKFAGQYPQKTIKDEIIAYLEKSMSYYVPKTISNPKDVESITPVIISESDELSSGTFIELGLIFKMKWGMEVKSENLGGKIDTKNFTISSNQLKEYLDGKKSVWKIDCSKTVNKEMEIVVSLNNFPDDKFKTLIPVKCDSENSPVVKLSNILKEYDEVKYLVSNVKTREFKTLKKLDETGYSTYPVNLLDISKKKDVETDLLKVKKDAKIGYIDKNGKIIIPLEYEDGLVDNFTNGFIGVKKGDKCGFINLKNKISIPFDYELVWYFNGSIAKIKNNGKFGFINQQGKLIAQPIYDEVWDAHNGIIVVKKDAKYGYISETGAIVANTIYDDAFDFNSEGLGTVVLNNKRGCIDKTGKIVVPIEFEKSPKMLNSDLLVVLKNGKYGIIKKDGKMLFDYKYDEIYNCGTAWGNAKDCEKYIRVKKDGLYGFVKTDGTVFRECVYSSADDFLGNIALITKTENGVEKKGELLLNSSDGKGNVYKSGYDNLRELEQEKDDVTTSSNSNTKSGTKAVSDKKTIKNTGKNILHMGADGSTGYSINGGSSRDFPCRQKVYYTFYQNGGFNGRGPVISEAKQDCGQTINANGDQYDKK